MLIGEIALIIAIVSAGLFAGLMFTLVVIMQRIWAVLSYPDYVAAMQTFLPAAKGHPLITLITLLPALAPIIPLLGTDTTASNPRLVLTAIGIVLGIAPFLVTLHFNFPVYTAMMSWQPDSPPADWQSYRRRFYLLNLVRFALSLAVMITFTLALGTD